MLELLAMPTVVAADAVSAMAADTAVVATTEADEDVRADDEFTTELSDGAAASITVFDSLVVLTLDDSVPMVVAVVLVEPAVVSRLFPLDFLFLLFEAATGGVDSVASEPWLDVLIELAALELAAESGTGVGETSVTAGGCGGAVGSANDKTEGGGLLEESGAAATLDSLVDLAFFFFLVSFFSDSLGAGFGAAAGFEAEDEEVALLVVFVATGAEVFVCSTDSVFLI